MLSLTGGIKARSTGIGRDLEKALFQYVETEQGNRTRREREKGGGKEGRELFLFTPSLTLYTLGSFEKIFISLPKRENKWKQKHTIVYQTGNIPTGRKNCLQNSALNWNSCPVLGTGRTAKGPDPPQPASPASLQQEASHVTMTLV